MLKTTFDLEENEGAPEISPDQLSKLKKEDMKQAIVERFRGGSDKARPHSSRSRVPSADWPPTDKK